MLRFFAPDNSQAALINKINQYQKLHKRPLISTTGYCHGLAILWLSKMSEENVEWFYEMVRYIINTTAEEMDEVIFEKFLAQIEFGQNPLNSGLNITQRHLKIILEMKNIETIGFNGAFPNLHRRIRPKKHPAMYLIRNDDHAIAVFHRGDEYHVYDSNYISGKAKLFDTKEAAAREIMLRLVPAEKQKEDENFDLDINYIPLAGFLSHPTYEVVIDIPAEASENRVVGPPNDDVEIDISADAEGYDADEDEPVNGNWRPCIIM